MGANISFGYGNGNAYSHYPTIMNHSTTGAFRSVCGGAVGICHAPFRGPQALHGHPRLRRTYPRSMPRSAGYGRHYGSHCRGGSYGRAGYGCGGGAIGRHGGHLRGHARGNIGGRIGGGYHAGMHRPVHRYPPRVQPMPGPICGGGQLGMCAGHGNIFGGAGAGFGMGGGFYTSGQAQLMAAFGAGLAAQHRTAIIPLLIPRGAPPLQFGPYQMGNRDPNLIPRPTH